VYKRLQGSTVKHHNNERQKGKISITLDFCSIIKQYTIIYSDKD